MWLGRPSRAAVGGDAAQGQPWSECGDSPGPRRGRSMPGHTLGKRRPGPRVSHSNPDVGHPRLFLSSHDRLCCPVRAERPAHGPSRPRLVPHRQPAGTGLVYVLLMVVAARVGAVVGAARAGPVPASNGGGAAGGWTRPAPGPPLPVVRAARRSQPTPATAHPPRSTCTTCLSRAQPLSSPGRNGQGWM